MRGVSAFVLAALAACSVGAQGETQPAASTQVEEIYVVRSVPESRTAPTEFCAQERTGFGDATYEGHYTFRSTATRTSDGRMTDTNVRIVGSLHLCAFGLTPDASTYKQYGEGTLGSTPFKGVGECRRGKADFPESGLRAVNCLIDLSGLPGEYVGGVLTSNTMQSSARVTMRGTETDPSGYTQGSIATIRLWRKRDASSSAMAQTKESLVGTWKLVSYTETTDKSGVTYPYGEHPTGFLTYTADGRVSVIITHEGRKPLSAPPGLAPREETSAAFISLAAYAGAYSVTGDKMTHHIEAAWAQNLVNTDQVRSVRLDGDRLTLRGGLLVNGVMYDGGSQLVWERLKPQTTDK